MGPIFRRDFDFLNHGQPQRQVEHFFVARTASPAVSIDAWTELEQLVMTDWRWWSVSELQSGDIRYFPDNLVELVLQADQIV